MNFNDGCHSPTKSLASPSKIKGLSTFAKIVKRDSQSGSSYNDSPIS